MLTAHKVSENKDFAVTVNREARHDVNLCSLACSNALWLSHVRKQELNPLASDIIICQLPRVA